MTTKARKNPTNLALKVAIVQSRRTSRRVAQLARIGEVRLSGIVTGRFAATEDEKRAIAKVVRRPIAELFPVDEAVAS